jgi:amidophosphoribosyltransferase
MVVRDYRKNHFTRCIHDISNTQFRSKFECELSKMEGRSGLGVISDNEDQPLLIGSHHGIYAIATVGKLHNLEYLVREAMASGALHFSEMSRIGFNPTEIVASLINCGNTILDGIAQAQWEIEGSCSMLLLTEKGIYAARDKLGRTPLSIGQKRGAYAVTFESCAFHNLGYEKIYSLGPGEVILLTPDGLEQVSPPGERMQICSFLWIYYGYPASEYEEVNVEAARYRCGKALAKADRVDVDFVAGIPDSGIGHAVGYATEAKIPYQRPFVKYTPTWPRSFMPQEQKVRDLVAQMKLIPISDLIKGNRLLFCEDSVVRGTQFRNLTSQLFELGAKEVHLRPACPPLLHSCKFLNFSQSRSELDLAARRAIRLLNSGGDNRLEEYADPISPLHSVMVEQIRSDLGLTTLKYQTIGDMVEAIGLPEEKLCTYCWNGREYG